MGLKGNTKKKKVKSTVGPIFCPLVHRCPGSGKELVKKGYMLHLRWPYRGLETACKRGYCLTVGSERQPEKERWGSLSGKSLPNFSQSWAEQKESVETNAGSSRVASATAAEYVSVSDPQANRVYTEGREMSRCQEYSITNAILVTMKPTQAIFSCFCRKFVSEI